ncbi:MAG: cytochrome c [Verrucomicrobia bacterium]|nr:cytochrome c [Verrucomicrobiota bacterium]
MSEPNQKTDLEDSAHATDTISDQAAAAREMSIPENGSQPISLWATVICGAVLILAGFILGYGGKRFSYAALFRDGYERTSPPGSTATPLPPKPALEAYLARGKKVFEAKCITCHGPEAKGNGTTYPSLVGSAWANGETERFSMIILNGLQGPTSNGKTYGVMTPQGIGMTPEELAGIMTYIRNHFGNTKGDVITVEMAKAAMQTSAARKKAGQAVTAEELTAEHLKALPGKEVTATTLVDPLTLDPVPATAAPAPTTPAPTAPTAPAPTAPAPTPPAPAAPAPVTPAPKAP